jgi:methyl-accepting chemotaxis protein
VTTTLLLVLAAVVAAALALLVRYRAGRRQRAMRALLDAADALEARLRTARAEIEAVAGDEDDPVRDALREMLRQRLWIQQHGASATLEELDTVRVSIDAARIRIDTQLDRIERARAPFTS